MSPVHVGRHLMDKPVLLLMNGAVSAGEVRHGAAQHSPGLLFAAQQHQRPGLMLYSLRY